MSKGATECVRGERGTPACAVLIVEDDEGVLDILEGILRRGGHQPLRARDGVEALTILDSRTPDLILCDRLMPRMSGFELLEVIRAERPELAAVPFVFLTALGDQRDQLATDPLAPTAYLTKPVRARVLLDTVDVLVGAPVGARDLGALETVTIADHAA